MNKPEEAYLFDMDGVLVDNCQYHVRAWLEFAERRGGHLTEKQVIDWMGAPGRDYILRMFDRPIPTAEITSLLEEKESIYREIYRPHLAARDGLVDFLKQARAKNIACAVTTGGPVPNVDFVLDGLGLRDYFSTIVDASQYQRGKPAPDCYLQTAARLAVDPRACTVFEDALNGIAAAQAANMRVVAITGTNPRSVLAAAAPNRIIDSFAEVEGED